MVLYCNMNAFSRLTSVINLYNENMNLEMTIKKLWLVYKFRVSQATENKHIFYFGLRPFMEDLTMLTLILKGRLLTPWPQVLCGGASN